MKIRIKRIHKQALLPKKANSSDAAFDLYIITDEESDNMILPGQTCLMRTGICIELPLGYYARIESRSSLAAQGIFVTGGIIDAGYRDEIFIILNNFSDNNFPVNTGDRLGQLIIHKIEPVDLVEVTSISELDNRGGGFGSSGT